MAHYALLFHAEGLDSVGPYIVAVLRAVDRSGVLPQLHAQMNTGQVLHYWLAYRPQGAKKAPGQEPTSVLGTDADSLSAVTWELANTLCGGWNTLERATLHEKALLGKLETVVLGPVARAAVEAVDRLVRAELPANYIGAALLDLGNPLHVRVFDEDLLRDGFLSEGRLYIRDHGSGEKPNLAWFGEEAAVPYEVLSPKRFAAMAPSREPILISPRGRQSAQTLERLAVLSPQQRVARELWADTEDDEALHASFEYSLGAPAGFDEIVIPEHKLTDYVLNQEHEEGKHKARVFSEVLAITKIDAAYLAEQIVAGLRRADFSRVRSETHGIKWHADIRVTGRNGAVRLVRTAWITGSGKPATLTTAYVLDEERQPENLRPDPRIVQLPESDEEWPAVVLRAARAAAKIAAERAVPIPVFLTGGDVLPEREGRVFVVLANGKSRFARLLRKTKLATTLRRRTAIMAPNSLLADRATAWAGAFAEVLRLNGIEASLFTIEM